MATSCVEACSCLPWLAVASQYLVASLKGVLVGSSGIYNFFADEADRLDGLYIQVGRSRPSDFIGWSAKTQTDRPTVYLRRSIAYTGQVQVARQ